MTQSFVAAGAMLFGFGVAALITYGLNRYLDHRSRKRAAQERVARLAKVDFMIEEARRKAGF